MPPRPLPLTQPPPDAMWVPDVARVAKLSPASVSRYNSLAEVSRRNQAEGRPGRQPTDRDLPVPDGYGYPPGRVSGSPSPWWRPPSISPWLNARRDISPGAPRGDGTPARPKKNRHAKPGPRPKQRTRPKVAKAKMPRRRAA